MPVSAPVKEALVGCASSLATSARVLFPERFFREFDPIHHQVFNAIQRSRSRYLAIAAPRGIGKTSINNLLLPATSILFQRAKYIVVVCASAEMAKMRSEDLKTELVENKVIKGLFGDVRGEVFNKDQWIAKVGDKTICVMPRGAGQKVRGMLYRNSRPDLIIVDDLESDEEVESEEQRAAKKRWFFNSLLNCVDRGSKDWRVIVLGTVLHHDSLLVQLLDNPKWESVQLEICDDEFRSNAPNFMSDDDCRALYQEFVEAGELEGWYREYRNMPVATGKDAAFRPEYFLHYREAEHNLSEDRDYVNVVIVDPAKTSKINSAETAIVAVAVNTLNNTIKVRKARGMKLLPSGIYDEICQTLEWTGARVLGVEVTGLHDFILHPLQNELIRRGFGHVEVIPLHARKGDNEKGKTARVRQLVHYYEQGLVEHNEADCETLEGQLLSFPRPKRWDVMDALGYLPEILATGEVFMRPYDGEYDDPATVAMEMVEVEAMMDMEAFRVI